MIMDDILEKLHLLDYKQLFCASKGKKPISRTYFALKIPQEPTKEKVQYFVELSYWLMSLGHAAGKNNNQKTTSGKNTGRGGPAA